MDVHGVSVKAAVSAWRWFPGFLLRRKYSRERLAQDIYVEVRSRNDPLRIDLGESSVVTLWLEVRNQSIVDVELDRANCLLRIGNQIIGMIYLKRQQLAAGAAILIDLHRSLHAEQANQVARYITLNDVSLEGFMEFNCKLHPFTKNIGHLSGIRPTVINARHRSPAQLRGMA
ncbi:hypothetical protein LBW60_21675 [Ralstonia solanacearum]|uniref:hypothetical protein n=1 Tax=Ralstonia solanacearum TaxID=305 RepID=UPI0023050B10|nr:hypothetical protein [Ralstonia solanacearum]MDB0510982.1 hypothetical protein [Ralstonia solanacearum]MDB0515936.1 hypothetical protein [Ralstonia solanacearum]